MNNALFKLKKPFLCNQQEKLNVKSNNKSNFQDKIEIVQCSNYFKPRWQ